MLFLKIYPRDALDAADDQKMADSQAYFDEMQSKYVHALDQAKTFLKVVSAGNSSKLNKHSGDATSKMDEPFAELLALSNLPKVELEKL
jgi:hypothetical protein